MDLIGLLNLGSLIFGLIVWVFPGINLSKYEKPNNRNWFAFTVISVSACTISLYFQIYSTYTIKLNVVTLIVYRNRTVK
ncbi:hypothetical protein CWR48_11540 [Oceanobacillus arenosus]|uniref:Uncharacterized protein n=1 Tax=Oceanobacillus arenosus TaxID=1229153 RepID=A0A3D8PSH1_9BACI|nr:hypothetical protein CWR48_11540 [Oceanobacillus arenosus]